MSEAISMLNPMNEANDSAEYVQYYVTTNMNLTIKLPSKNMLFLQFLYCTTNVATMQCAEDTVDFLYTGLWP